MESVVVVGLQGVVGLVGADFHAFDVVLVVA
jgi:hypothetical protein